MAKKYYTRVFPATAGTLARANDVRDDFSSIESGLDTASLDIERSIKLPLGEATDHLLDLTPAQRANTLLGFNGAGALTTYIDSSVESSLPPADVADNMLRVNAGATAWESVAPATVRTLLGLSPAATAAFGVMAGQVAEGNHLQLVQLGGTGLTTLTNHGVMLGQGTANVDFAVPGTAGIPLISNGASLDPVFGTALVVGGGTGRATLTDRAVLIGRGTAAIDQVGPGTSGQALISNGAGSNPSFQGILSSLGINATVAEINENDRSAEAVTDHHLCLRDYDYNGSTVPSVLDIDSIVTEDTFESFGPTGSGATNIWTAMDDITSEGKVVKINYLINMTSNSTGIFKVSLIARPGDTSWATGGGSYTGAVIAQLQGDADASGESIHVVGNAEIALDEGDQTFDLTWVATNNSVENVQMYYRGFKA